MYQGFSDQRQNRSMQEGRDLNNTTLYLLYKQFPLCCTGLKTHMRPCLIITTCQKRHMGKFSKTKDETGQSAEGGESTMEGKRSKLATQVTQVYISINHD